MSLPASTAERRKAEANENTFALRPALEQRFPAAAARDIIKAVLKEKLQDAKYGPENTKDVADTIKNRLKALGLPRYKYAVQVVVGENKGQGVHMGSRCIWDPATDGQASETYANEHVFAVGIVYAAYYY